MARRQNIYFTDQEAELLEAAFPNLSFGKAVKTALRLNFLEGFIRVGKHSLEPGDYIADIPGGMVRRVHGAFPNFYVWRKGHPERVSDLVWRALFIQNDDR